MDIQQCYKILGIEPGATPEEIRQTYKDLVSVWHPDRFPNNPRLRQKAEDQLKKINVAYAYIRENPSPCPSSDQTASGNAPGECTSSAPPSYQERISNILDWLIFHKSRVFTICLGSLLLGVAILIGKHTVDALQPGFIRSHKIPEAASGTPGNQEDPDAAAPETDGSDKYAWIEDIKKRIEWERLFKMRLEEKEQNTFAPSPDQQPPVAEEPAPQEEEEDGDWLVVPEIRVWREPAVDYEQLEAERRRKEQVRLARLRRQEEETRRRQRLEAELRQREHETLVSTRQEKIRRLIRHSGGRYVEQGKGVVLDTHTGLMWCMLDSYLESGRYMNYTSARSYVGRLETGGYQDWRLPAAGELSEIYRNAPVFPTIGARWYWTSEQYNKGWHRVVRVITPDGLRSGRRQGYATTEEYGTVHAVRP